MKLNNLENQHRLQLSRVYCTMLVQLTRSVEHKMANKLNARLSDQLLNLWVIPCQKVLIQKKK
jgi:hypothetical protein